MEEKEQKELEENIKKEMKKHEKILKNIFITLGVLVVLFVGVYFFIGSTKHFEYRGVGFSIVDEIAPYMVSVPVRYQDGVTGEVVSADYNIYLRKDPRKLEDVFVDGEIVFRPNMVISIDDEKLFCDGDRIIAIGNLQKLNLFGIDMIAKNESEIKLYIPQSEYMFLEIKEGNETSIIQKNGNRYEMNVADCEILEATERLMLEAFVQAFGNN
jgi:hypothetical protein